MSRVQTKRHLVSLVSRHVPRIEAFEIVACLASLSLTGRLRHDVLIFDKACCREQFRHHVTNSCRRVLARILSHSSFTFGSAKRNSCWPNVNINIGVEVPSKEKCCVTGFVNWCGICSSKSPWLYSGFSIESRTCFSVLAGLDQR